MSTETAKPTEPKLPPLPERTESITVASWNVPHILLDSSNGIDRIRRGGQRQVKIKTEIWFTEEKQDEPSMPIVAQNSFNIGGIRFDVLNDEGDFGGQFLIASEPTSSKYLSQVGKDTVVSFTSDQIPPTSNAGRNLERPVFKNVRSTVLEMP